MTRPSGTQQLAISLLEDVTQTRLHRPQFLLAPRPPAPNSVGETGSVLSLRHGWGIRGLWVSMTYVLFGVRFLAHLWRFNSIRGPFGPSTFWNNLPVSSETSVATQRGITLAGTDISGGTDISARTTRSYND